MIHGLTNLRSISVLLMVVGLLIWPKWKGCLLV